MELLNDAWGPVGFIFDGSILVSYCNIVDEGREFLFYDVNIWGVDVEVMLYEGGIFFFVIREDYLVVVVPFFGFEGSLVLVDAVINE